MKIKSLQNYIKDRLNACEALTKGGCKAFSECSLSVLHEVAEQLQEAAGIAIVVTTPEFTRNGSKGAGLIPSDTQIVINCIETPALNRENHLNLTSLDAAELVAHELDGDKLCFLNIRQFANEANGTLTASVKFATTINL